MRDSLVEGPLTYFIGKMGESPYSGSLGNFGQSKPDLFEKQGTLCLANDRFWPLADCQIVDIDEARMTANGESRHLELSLTKTFALRLLYAR